MVQPGRGWPQRRAVLEQLLGRLGRDAIIEPPFFCTYGQNTYLGDHVFLNTMCVVIDNNEVRIGDHAMIGPLVQIYTAAHPLEAEARNRGAEVARPIVIEDNVWVGGGAILLPGVRSVGMRWSEQGQSSPGASRRTPSWWATRPGLSGRSSSRR